MTHVDLRKLPSLIVTWCNLHNIVIDRNDIIDEGLLFWSHYDEKYTEIVDRTALEVEAGQLQLAITKHIYIFLKLNWTKVTRLQLLQLVIAKSFKEQDKTMTQWCVYLG